MLNNVDISTSNLDVVDANTVSVTTTGDVEVVKSSDPIVEVVTNNYTISSSGVYSSIGNDTSWISDAINNIVTDNGVDLDSLRLDLLTYIDNIAEGVNQNITRLDNEDIRLNNIETTVKTYSDSNLAIAVDLLETKIANDVSQATDIETLYTRFTQNDYFTAAWYNSINQTTTNALEAQSLTLDAVTSSIDNATTGLTATADAVSYLKTKVGIADDPANETGLLQAVKILQGQVDGTVETFMRNEVPVDTNGAPLTTVEPYSIWYAADTANGNTLERSYHTGDTYILVADTTTQATCEANDGVWSAESSSCSLGDKIYLGSYRFIKGDENASDTDSEGFGWARITDSLAIEALEKAIAAGDLADGKRRVFVDPDNDPLTEYYPAPPYDKGDIWVCNNKDHTYEGELLRSTATRISTDAFNDNDWVPASNYKLLINELDARLGEQLADITDLQAIQDGNIQIYFYTTLPEDLIPVDYGSIMIEHNPETQLDYGDLTLHTSIINKGILHAQILNYGDYCLDTDDYSNGYYSVYFWNGPDDNSVEGDWVLSTNALAKSISDVYKNDLAITDTRGIADSKVKVWYQDTDPNEDIENADYFLSDNSIGDYWVDTDEADYGHKTKMWSGSKWIELSTASDDILKEAVSSLAGLKETDDGVVQSFYQDSAPTSGMSYGDWWIDTNATPIVAYRYEDIDGKSIGVLKWRDASNSIIGKAYIGMVGAQETADGKVDSYYMSLADASKIGKYGDLLFDSVNGSNKPYRHDGNTWVPVDDIRIGETIEDFNTFVDAVTYQDLILKKQLDGTINVYLSGGFSTRSGVEEQWTADGDNFADHSGDIWVDEDNGDNVWIYDHDITSWKDMNKPYDGLLSAEAFKDNVASIYYGTYAQRDAKSASWTAQQKINNKGNIWIVPVMFDEDGELVLTGNEYTEPGVGETSDAEVNYIWTGANWAEFRDGRAYATVNAVTKLDTELHDPITGYLAADSQLQQNITIVDGKVDTNFRYDTETIINNTYYKSGFGLRTYNTGGDGITPETAYDSEFWVNADSFVLFDDVTGNKVRMNEDGLYFQKTDNTTYKYLQFINTYSNHPNNTQIIMNNVKRVPQILISPATMPSYVASHKEQDQTILFGVTNVIDEIATTSTYSFTPRAELQLTSNTYSDVILGDFADSDTETNYSSSYILGPDIEDISVFTTVQSINLSTVSNTYYYRQCVTTLQHSVDDINWTDVAVNTTTFGASVNPVSVSFSYSNNIGAGYLRLRYVYSNTSGTFTLGDPYEYSTAQGEYVSNASAGSSWYALARSNWYALVNRVSGTIQYNSAEGIQHYLGNAFTPNELRDVYKPGWTITSFTINAHTPTNGATEIGYQIARTDNSSNINDSTYVDKTTKLGTSVSTTNADHFDDGYSSYSSFNHSTTSFYQQAGSTLDWTLQVKRLKSVTPGVSNSAYNMSFTAVASSGIKLASGTLNIVVVE